MKWLSRNGLSFQEKAGISRHYIYAAVSRRIRARRLAAGFAARARRAALAERHPPGRDLQQFVSDAQNGFTRWGTLLTRTGAVGARRVLRTHKQGGDGALPTASIATGPRPASLAAPRHFRGRSHSEPALPGGGRACARYVPPVWSGCIAETPHGGERGPDLKRKTHPPSVFRHYKFTATSGAT